MINDDEEDEFAARAHALSLLNGDDESDAYTEDAEDIVFGDNDDDLEHAIKVGRLIPASDQLAHKAAVRQLKYENADKIARHVSINPPSANRGTLGGQQEVSAAPNPLTPLMLSTVPLEVAWWAADSDTEATAVTVTLSPVQQIFPATPGEVFAFSQYRPYAILQFGNRGFSVKAEVDIGRGCQLTVGASSVIVQVAMEPEVPGIIPASMKLAGMLSFLPVIRTKPITRTKYIDFVLGGVTTNVVIPNFAKDVTLWRTPVATPVTLDVLDRANVIIYSFVLGVGASMFEPMLLSGDAVSINVTPVGGVIDHARLIFGLEF